MKTCDLTGAALDWAVAIANGVPAGDIVFTKGSGPWRRTRDGDGKLTGSYQTGPEFRFHSKWEAAGPIIDREDIDVISVGVKNFAARIENASNVITAYGSTRCIAAMRCFVRSKLGDEVDVPDELIKEY